jgi:hypothetical protein
VRVTKAAPNVLEEFERTALVGNPMYNRVYLRLFMRGYAEVIGIRTDDALRAADEMLKGRYTDRLARLYLEDYAGESAETADEGTPGAPDAEVPKSDSSSGSSKAAASAAASSPAVGQPATAAADSKPSDKSAKPAAATIPGSKTPSRVAAGSTAIPSKASGSGADLSKGAVAGVAGFALVAVVALAAWFFWPDSVETTPVPAVAIPADTVRVQAPQLPPRIVLGDTTSFFVIAARDTLNPIRVTPDGGIRAPHWIELGDSLEFRVANELVLEMRLNAVDVSVHDVLLPTTGRDAARRLVLTKDFAQAYLDSLRTAGGAPGSAAGNE